MIIVPVKEGENIERALKKFKRKFEKTGVVKELRARQQFNKPSVLKRLKMEHAIYVQKLRQSEECYNSQKIWQSEFVFVNSQHDCRGLPEVYAGGEGRVAANG